MTISSHVHVFAFSLIGIIKWGQKGMPIRSGKKKVSTVTMRRASTYNFEQIEEEEVENAENIPGWDC